METKEKNTSINPNLPASTEDQGIRQYTQGKQTVTSFPPPGYTDMYLLVYVRDTAISDH